MVCDETAARRHPPEFSRRLTDSCFCLTWFSPFVVRSLTGFCQKSAGFAMRVVGGVRRRHRDLEDGVGQIGYLRRPPDSQGVGRLGDPYPARCGTPCTRRGVRRCRWRVPVRFAVQACGDGFTTGQAVHVCHGRPLGGKSSRIRIPFSVVVSLSFRVVQVPADGDELTGLALAAGRGDRAALERFVRASQREVWRLVAHLADVGVADDLTQETYLRAIPSLARFAGRSSARTWLLSIARRVVVDHIRAIRSRPRAARTDDWVQAADQRQAAVHGASAGFEDMVELAVLLDALEPERREALVLTQIIGLSYAEAAEICRCPVGTIRSRVARARGDLERADEQRRNDTG